MMNLLTRYATILSLIIQVFYYKNIIQFTDSILLISTLVYVGGFYITYITPKYVFVPELKLTVKGNILKLLDFLFHQLPFYIFLYMHFTKKIKYKKDNLLFVAILSFFYFLLHDPCNVYNITKKDIIIIIIFSLPLFCLLKLSGAYFCDIYF